MNKHPNFNTKGVSDVKNETGTTNADDEIFDLSKAGMSRDKNKWDDFQLVGDTNMEEINHASFLKQQKSADEFERDLKRARRFLQRRGKKILQAQMA